MFLYADDTCLFYQHKKILSEQKNPLKISLKLVSKYMTGLTLDINYGDIKTKQCYKVIYLGCELNENLSGEVMALKVINKVNGWLKFPYRKNRFKTYLKSLLYNAIIQPHFDYVCSAWYPNLRSSKANCKLSKTSVFDSVFR